MQDSSIRTFQHFSQSYREAVSFLRSLRKTFLTFLLTLPALPFFLCPFPSVMSPKPIGRFTPDHLFQQSCITVCKFIIRILFGRYRYPLQVAMIISPLYPPDISKIDDGSHLFPICSVPIKNEVSRWRKGVQWCMLFHLGA